MFLIGASFEKPLARFFAGEGKRRAGCRFFRNQRDARVRVLRNSPAFYFRIRANPPALSVGVPAIAQLREQPLRHEAKARGFGFE
jgi:hypothetical protein